MEDSVRFTLEFVAANASLLAGLAGVPPAIVTAYRTRQAGFDTEAFLLVYATWILLVVTPISVLATLVRG